MIHAPRVAPSGEDGNDRDDNNNDEKDDNDDRRPHRDNLGLRRIEWHSESQSNANRFVIR